MLREYRLAFRSLLRRPGLTAAAVLALGLALAASGTIFGLVDGLWLRPPGVTAPGELVRVFAVTHDSSEGLWSYPEVRDLQARTTSLSHIVARGQRGSIVPDAAGEPTLVLVNVVSPDFFEALGVKPAWGRLPAAADQAPVVALGHAYWRLRFGGDPSVIGTTLPLGARQSVRATIIGILPPTFRELEAASDRDLWMTPATWSALAGPDEFNDRLSRWFSVVGRRAPGYSVKQVATEMRMFDEPDRRARVVADSEHRLASGGRNVLALLSLVVVVGLITCVNLAELLLASAAQRRQEFATRVALGASQSRLVKAMVAEGLLLGVGGLLIGLVLTSALLRIVPAVMVPPPGFRSFLTVGLDGRVVVFLAVAAVLFTVLFSLAPARLAARTDLLPIIKGGGHAAAKPAARVRVPFGPVLQVALAFVLLSAAMVLGRSFLASQSPTFGLTDAPVLTVWSMTDLPPANRTQAESRLRDLPGVADVALAIRAPLSLSGGGRAASVRMPGAEPIEVKYNAVSANYFSTIGTDIIAGRGFADDDERTRRKIAIVSRTLADRWPGGVSPVGGRLLIGEAGEPWEVVGVAEDAAINTIGEPAEPYLYLPFATYAPGEVTFLLTLNSGAAVPARDIRSVLIEIDRGLEPRRIVPMQQYVDYATRDYRATAMLAGALGALGLILTLVGVYGVTAYRTARRTREFGIRAALGARRVQILRESLRDTLALVVVGTSLGVIVSLWTNRVLGALLLGVRPWDPWSLVLAASVLMASLTAATFVPALRASSIDPSQALRER